ncbi:CG0192-related protein [Isoptericola jiangsuensis]|uniref:CG0192-related protein n=1 Tax=Isoptericola jiangsuensis TaxID=548579 RepID=UPI003AAE365E
MAILHRATLVPTKMELLAAWLPDQDWSDGSAEAPTPVAAYRFDDPAGQVGIESHLVEVGGRTFHVPVTYRGAPLDGVQTGLVGTLEHSVLGTRWVYDAVVDPVYLAEVARVIREADTQVDLVVETPAGPERREQTMGVRGSGGTVPDHARVVVVRKPSTPASAGGPALTGTWPGRTVETVLVHLA